MDILMTRTAKDQRFAATRCHARHPGRLFPAGILLEVFERPNMVYLYLVRGSTLFTNLRQEPLFEF
jgi:hypothetical protein